MRQELRAPSRRTSPIITVTTFVAAMLLVALSFVPPVVSADSGEFNWEKIRPNDPHSLIEVRRTPNLIFNSEGTPTAFTPSGFEFSVTMWSYNAGCPGGDKCVPSRFRLDLLVDDTNQYDWQGNEFVRLSELWPGETTEYGSTVAWSWEAGVDYILTGTLSQQFTWSALAGPPFEDYTRDDVYGGWTQIGYLAADYLENHGWGGATTTGAWELGIQNEKGHNIHNHNFNVWSFWTLYWRRCSNWWPHSCYDEVIFYGNMYQGDNLGDGDGWLYVKDAHSARS
jgi:hypothetical protein